MKTLTKNILAAAAILAVTLVFFSAYIFSGNIPYAGDFTGSDLTELNLPLRFLAAQSLAAGQVPLWTDMLANGFPLLAEGQAGVFYPFNLLYCFLPFPLAVNLGLMLNFFLAGLFTFLYCRRLKLSFFASIFSATAFAFGGFFVFRIKHLNMINAAIWLPLLFYLTENYFAGIRKFNWLAAIAVVFAVQFLAGHPQISFISLVSVFLYFAIKLLVFNKFNINDILNKFFLPWIVIGLIAFSLSAVQFLPTFFYTVEAGRGLNMGFAGAGLTPYPPSALFYYILPYFMGNPAVAGYPPDVITRGVFWENNVFFGRLALALALVGALAVIFKKRQAGILIILPAFLYLLVFASYTPGYFVIERIIPGFSLFRFPQRFLVAVVLCLAVLAGFGFDYCRQKLLLWQKNRPRLAPSERLFTILVPLMILVILVTELYVTAAAYWGSLDLAKYLAPPQSATFLRSDDGQFRIYSVNWPGTWQSIYQISGGWQNNMMLYYSGRELVPPNLGVFWDLPSAQDRASREGGMLPRETHIISERLLAEFVQAANDQKPVSDQALRILGLENVKYLLSFSELKSGQLALAREFKADFLPALKIYENRLALPPAWGVFAAVSATSSGQLFEPGFDPAKQVIINEPVAPGESPTGTASVGNWQQQGSRISGTADFSAGGHLVISQTYLPGWRAKIDNQPAPVYRANFAFLALRVPAGEHQIALEYRPASFVIGRLISLLSLVSLVIILLAYNFFLSQNNKKNLRKPARLE